MTQTFETAQDTVYALAAFDDGVLVGCASGLYRTREGDAKRHDLFASLTLAAPLSVTALAVDGSTLFAGVNGAVLRSGDSGENWQIVGLSAPAPQVTSLAISPHFANDGVVVAGTSEDGVFVSTDRGATWTPWNFGLIDLNVYALAISPDFPRDQTIFAGTVSGIFRSHNGGRSWREANFPMDAAPVVSLAFSPNGSIFAGTEAHGLFVSDDFGAHWRQASSDFASAGVNAIQTTPDRTWLLIEDRLVSSSDGGSSWRQHEAIPADKLGIAMLVHPSAPGVVIVGCADGDLLELR